MAVGRLGEGSRAPRGLLYLTGTVLLALLLLPVLLRLSSDSIWDDSYMYYRYATNFITEGRVSFNLGQPPAFGLTSPAFLAIVVPIRLMTSNPPLVIALASLICGVLFVGLALVWLAKHLDIQPRLRIPVVLLVLASLTFSMKTLSTHFVSGMDTAFVLLYFTAYLVLAKRWERSASMKGAAIAALWGGLAFFVRPDLLVYTTIVPSMVAVFRREGNVRRQALFILATAAIMTLAQMLAASVYFDSWLPLSFYAKSGGVYGEYIHSQYLWTPIEELGQYVGEIPFLLGAIFLPIGLGVRKWWGGMTIVDRGVLVGTILFLAYYLFFVLQIMSYSARFYYPTLPAFILLAARSVGAVEGFSRFPRSKERGGRRPVWVWGVVGIGAVVALAGWRGIENARYAKGALPRQARFSFDIERSYHDRSELLWSCLDGFSALPDDLVMATTEVGHPAAMNPHQTVIDLSGLNETSIARGGFDAAEILGKYRPDLIYMPHYHYVEFNVALLDDQSFRKDYEFFYHRDIGARMSIALRRESRYFEQMRELVVTNCGRGGRGR